MTTVHPKRPIQCVIVTNLGRCRRTTRRANGLCSECDSEHSARQFAVLDSYSVGAEQ